MQASTVIRIYVLRPERRDEGWQRSCHKEAMTITKTFTAVAFAATFALAAAPAHAQAHRGGAGRSVGRGVIRGGVVVRGGGGFYRPYYARPYYSFRPRVSLGFGLWVGYPVRYPY